MVRSPTIRMLAAGLSLLLALSNVPHAHADQVRDLCDVVGVRDNQLLGYGVVTGLDGTGDDVSAPFAAQSMISLMRRMGVQVEASQLRLRNVAAVVVTATIPPFARPGARLDVTVSSIGNAKSLQGGVLLQTRLLGADQRVYAVGQGPLVLGGFGASGKSGSSVQKNSLVTARVPNGALVERSIPTTIASRGRVVLALRQQDFTTAQRLTTVINQAFGPGTARAVDAGSVEVLPPVAFQNNLVALIAALQPLEVQPAQNAVVIINERTGTIVAGGDVRISPVAISHGGLTVVIKEAPEVSQPNPLGQGDTTTVPKSDVTAEEASPAVAYVDAAASLADVAQALSTLGVAPRDLASILQAMHGAGALRARVEVQ